MIDVYFTISRQYLKYANKDFELLGKSLEILGYTPGEYELRKFSSSVYSTCEQEVGYPDFMVVSVPHIGKKIGKGSYKEIKYARDNEIPVFVVQETADNMRKLFLVDYVEASYGDDWSEYAILKLYDHKPIDKQRMKAIFSNFNIPEPEIAEDRWIVKDTPEMEDIKQDQTEDVMLLL